VRAQGSRHGARLAVALAVVIAAQLPSTATSVGAAAPGRPAGIDHRVSQAQDDLVAANRAVARAATQLAAARSALPAAQARLASATTALGRARQTAAEAAAAQAAADAPAALAARRLADAQGRIAATTLQIGALARAVYTQGPYAEIAAILSASTPSDFAASLEAVRSVSRSQNQALADLQQARAALALAQAQATASQLRAADARRSAMTALAAATSLAGKARSAQARVASLVAARAGALSVAARERRSVKRQYDALRAEQARLRRLEQHRSNHFRGTPTGVLDWPIPGAEIVGGVGWRVHPVYGYRSCHTGLDIRGGTGTPILAPADGLVIAVISGGAYGLHTLVDHGRGLVTMYAHQSRTAVVVGETVRRGEVIGYVGASGWVTGPHLHWEVHVNGVPYDPLGWFGSPRVPVPCWAG
jgi:murein DD-endopeptidase MepM/ murein hydrolase activator NlpD